MSRRESGRGRGKRGPQLPFKLSKELFGSRHSERRVVDKKPRWQSNAPGERSSNPGHYNPAHFNKRKSNATDTLPGPTSKRNRANPTVDPKSTSLPGRLDGERIARRGANRFSELLPQHSMDREKLLQRDLARKLGMKKKSTSHLPGDEDGLDELMQEFDHSDGSDHSDAIMVQSDAQFKDGPHSSWDTSSQEESDDLLGSVDLEESSLSEASESEPESESEGESEPESEPVRKKQSSTGTQKYVPPALRGLTTQDGGESSQRVVRQIRGLLNRMAESNMVRIVEQISTLYQNEGRSLVSNAVASELISASAEGPRATQRFAAVAAALISGLAGLNKSQELVASFLSKVADALEGAMKAEEADSLAISNLIQMIAQLFLLGSLKEDVVFSLLEYLCLKFTETNIAAIAQLLQAAGLALRSSNPERMKDFIISVHARAADVGVKNLSVRARVMMDIVVDVKNNRKRELNKRELTQRLDSQVLRWLKGAGISGIALGGISWETVLEKDKRGFWWIPTATKRMDPSVHPKGVGGVDRLGPLLTQDEGITPPETLLKLASQMNMNTDTRRAVFCAIMGSEDAVDATEKLLRLGLKGDQERQIVRVTIECCMGEKSYNPYYLQILKRLCTLDKNHRVTLQYCMWDNWKTLERLDIGALHNLARLGAGACSSSCLSPTALRVVDFLSLDIMTERQLLFWKILFESMLKEVKSQEEMVVLFSKIMMADNLANLRRGLLTFIKRSVGPWIAQKKVDINSGSGGTQVEVLLKRCRLMERVLAGKTG